MTSSKMCSFVMHRGLIIATIQFYFMVIFFFIDIPIFNGFLVFGYSTIFTNLPVIAIIMDEDLDFQKIKDYPELYKELQQGRLLSHKAFFIMLLKGVFQVELSYKGLNNHPLDNNSISGRHGKHRHHHLHFADTYRVVLHV